MTFFVAILALVVGIAIGRGSSRSRDAVPEDLDDLTAAMMLTRYGA